MTVISNNSSVSKNVFFKFTENDTKKHYGIVNLLKNNIPMQFSISQMMLKKYFEALSTLNPIYIAGLLSKKKKISQLESSMNETAVGPILKKETNFSLVSNFVNKYYLQQFLINMHNSIMNSQFEKSDLVLGADLRKDVENYKKQRFNIDKEITTEVVKELFSLLRVMHQKVGEVSKMSDPKLHVSQVIKKDELNSRLKKINTIMKDWRHILACIFTVGVYAIVLALKKEKVVNAITKIVFQKASFDYSSHEYYHTPDERKKLVSFFFAVVAKNTLVDSKDSEHTYFQAKKILEDPNTKEVIDQNTFIDNIQCLTPKVIDSSIGVYMEKFSGKVFKDYGNPNATNVTHAVPKLVLVGKDQKAREFLEAVAAKDKNFQGYEDSLKLKYQRILDQVAYFDVEKEIRIYLQAVPTSLSEMNGKVISKEIIQAHADLINSCLAKINLVLDGDEKVKQIAIERVKVGRKGT